MLKGLLIDIRMAAALGLAAFAGYVAMTLHVPLAWTLAPLLVTACLCIVGADLRPGAGMRRIGQLIIGAAVGLNISGPVLAELLRWTPLMVLSAFLAVLASCVTGTLLARHARIDPKTAFFASLPGGLAEMGNIGVQVGARAEPIAIVHALRVMLVVVLVPPVLVALGSPDFASPPAAEIVAWHYALGLVAGGAVVAYLLRFVRLNNPYMIGSVIFTGVFAANGLVAGKMPPLLFSVAQLLIGFVVGCRFRRDMLVQMPRVALFGGLSILGLVVLMAGYGMLLSVLTGLPYPAAILATSPGGLSEMSIAAQVLHLAVPTVVGFQVVRGVLVNGFAYHYFTLLTKLGFFTALQNLLGTTDKTKSDSGQGGA